MRLSPYTCAIFTKNGGKNIVKIWNEEAVLPSAAETERLKPRLSVIKEFEPEKDGYIFLHGVAIEFYKGKLFAAWAHNKDKENSTREEVNFAISGDDGKTWSPMIKGPERHAEGGAVSHGAFLTHGGKLYVAYSVCERDNRNRAELAVLLPDVVNKLSL